MADSVRHAEPTNSQTTETQLTTGYRRDGRAAAVNREGLGAEARGVIAKMLCQPGPRGGP
jgi:hypothetical protein